MNFKDKELIIFDFDGTLINSVPDLTLAINTMLKHFQLPEVPVEEVAPFIGNGARTLVKRALKHSMIDAEITDEFFEEAFAFYLKSYGEVPCKDTYLYPGVVETLEYLDEKGYKMVICTNKPYAFIEPILDQLNIKQFFKIWIGEDSLLETKPNAAPLLHLANEMKITTEKCIMVGDSKNDILAAQNAKIDSIGLTYGYNYNEHIVDYNPTIVANDFAQLQNIF